MQAFWLEAVFTFTRFPDVFSEGVASRHLPQGLAPDAQICSVHGKTIINFFPLCLSGLHDQILAILKREREREKERK